MTMNKTYLIAVMASVAMTSVAQDVPATGDTYMAASLATEDLNGTARYVAMGGALDALGADISVIGSNPAGIGLFRKSQVSGSLGVVSQQDGKSFSNGTQTNMSFDQLGIVLATRSGRHGFLNLGFNFHKSRNFDYVLSAVNALNGSAQNRQTVLKDMNGLMPTSYSLPYSQLDALYLNNMNLEHDPATGEDVVVDYAGTDYEFDRAHTGYIGEYDFNLSGNINNRVYLGLTVGINSVHYKGYSEYFEHLASNIHPEVLISDNQEITGYGYNVKAGIIVRPFAESAFRIGAAVHTPTFYKLTMDNFTTIGTDVDRSSASEDFRFNTPWKFSLSAGHTIGTNLALGIVYEYSDFTTCDMRTIDGYNYEFQTEGSTTDQPMKHHIEKSLKGVSTLKAGAEFKPTSNVALRIGYNYMSAAFRGDAVRDQTLMSPGVYYSSTTDYTNWGATRRLTAGVGFTLSKSTRLDIAYQYQKRSGDFFPFMKEYSAGYYEQVNDAQGNPVLDAQGNPAEQLVTLSNSCQPVRVKDNRHQFMATFSYSF